MVSPGCIVSGGRVRRSVLAPFVRVNSYSDVDGSIVMPHAVIGRYSRVRRAIIDEGVVLAENSSVGYDRESDLAQGRVVTESGITVVPARHPRA